MTTKVSRLLERYIAALPERQRQMRERSPHLGEEYSLFKVNSPEPLPEVLQTLDAKASRPISPQLRDWYTAVGILVESSWKYLSPSAIKSTVKRAKLKEIVAAHREYWDESAPMKFPNSQLSVFALIGDLNDGDLIYLVWPKADSVEPELWEYFGQAETRYKDVCSYITSLLEGS